jgi:hypothetical protein
MENECQDMVEGLAHSKMKEETTNNRRIAMDEGAMTTLGKIALTTRKMMVINLDRLVPYEGTAWDEQP